MERAELTQGIAEIAQMFEGNNTWPPRAIAEVWDELIILPVQAMQRAKRRILREFSPKFFPPIGKVADVITAEGEAFREEKQRQRQQQVVTGPERAQSGLFRLSSSNDEYAARAFQLIQQLNEGSIEKTDYDQECEELHKRYAA